MRTRLLVGLLLLSAATGFSQSDLTEVNRLEAAGQFKAASQQLTQQLRRDELAPAQRKVLEFELDRLERIKKDFPYTKDELFTELKSAVKGLTRAEFDGWVAAGRFDSRNIDGRRWFMGSSVDNLFFRYRDLAARRIPAKDSSEEQRRHYETCVTIEQAARAAHKPYVLPKRFEATMTVTAKANAAPDGQLVRAWLPIPREYPFQDSFTLLSASPAPTRIADKDSPIRSVFLEEPAKTNQATEFQVRYEYTADGVWFDVDPARVRAANPDDASLKPFTAEAPHIVFTPEMRALSQQIAGDEPNPYLRARKFYDWIAGNIKYSYAIEYSTIRNISDYCRSHGYGDCGQEALLFMTLCRLNGIPARWQSGWNTFPGGKSIHDWSEIYIAPYGWMPVDPYMGIYAMRYATNLSSAQRLTMRDFYFGGLDQYRMIANSDHNQRLEPPKDSMRSDNVDFQRGELEWDHHNIYFDQYSYSLTIKELPHAPLE